MSVFILLLLLLWLIFSTKLLIYLLYCKLTIAVKILFCLDFANLSLAKRDAKKIATESRFPAPKYLTKYRLLF